MSCPVEIFNADVVLYELNRQYVYISLPVLKNKVRCSLKPPAHKPVLLAHWLEMILEKLERDQHILVRTVLDDCNQPFKEYNISFEGSLFINSGGYGARYLEEEKRNQLQEKQIEAVISTNKSVQSINKYQKWILGVTSVVTVISAIISGVTLNKIIDINPVQPPLINAGPLSHLKDSTEKLNAGEGLIKTSAYKSPLRKEPN